MIVRNEPRRDLIARPFPKQSGQEKQLPRDRPFKPPCVYGDQMRDYAIWDCQFLERLWKGPSVQHFSKPPQTVLAIGEGVEFWVLSAAKRWPNTRFYCHDLSGVGSKFNRVLPYLNIFSRVTYVNTTELGQSCPYPDDYFDLVLFRFVTPFLPEKKWANTIEEGVRVAKPGGVVEIISDDLIFPGARVRKPPQSFLTPNTPSTTGPLSSSDLTSSSQTSFDPSSSTDGPLSPGPRTHRTSVSHSGTGLRPRIDSADSYFPPPQLPPIDTSHGNPLDHSRLAAAWEEMLDARSIPQLVTSVVPFYLSALSNEFRVLPTLDIRMPNPVASGADEQLIDVNKYATLGNARVKHDHDVQSSEDDLSHSTHSLYSLHSNGTSMSNTEFLAANAPMHLARAVQMVRNCRKAIQEAYEALYGQDMQGPSWKAVKVAKGDHVPVSEKDGRSGIVEQFEHDWQNWEEDMASRIGMRDVAASLLKWNEPDGEPPNWRLWREKLWYPASERLSGDQPKDVELCRTLRGFVLYKPTN
ncbi:unnamed protein product [Peniophora sp. CBMAI 1063]|nr:unnamed protein product [Peniophora sp. CBMAI 1063]